MLFALIEASFRCGTEEARASTTAHGWEELGSGGTSKAGFGVHRPGASVTALVPAASLSVDARAEQNLTGISRSLDSTSLVAAAGVADGHSTYSRSVRVTGTIRESIEITQHATVERVVQGSMTIRDPAVVTLTGVSRARRRKISSRAGCSRCDA